MKIINQSMSGTFKNPFYCGLMAHNLLEGKLVNGNHEKLISKEIFLKVNDVQSNNAHGYKVDSEPENLPMKQFMKCETCGNGLTGYMVKKKKIWYYKCRIKGCCNNKSVKDLHNRFDDIISHFTLKPEYVPILREQMLLTIENLNRDNEENRKRLKAESEELNRKIERTEERYMNEEIAQDMFLKYSEKFKLERIDLLKKMQELESSCSNHADAVDLALDYACNLPKMWHSGSFMKRQRLQYFLFPEGLRYNKKNDQVRTTKYNSVFLWMVRQQQDLDQNKSGIPSLSLDYPTLVVPTGIEPVTQGFSVLCSTD
jgi:site-specific DNA recombinase